MQRPTEAIDRIVRVAYVVNRRHMCILHLLRSNFRDPSGRTRKGVPAMGQTAPAMKRNQPSYPSNGNAVEQYGPI